MSDIVFDNMMFDYLERQAERRYEVERLRITDAERDAIRWASQTLCVGWNDLRPQDRDRSRKAAATLKSLLERIG